MTDLLGILLAFEVGTTLKTVIGVLMALSGLGVLLMGVIAMRSVVAVTCITVRRIGGRSRRRGIRRTGADDDANDRRRHERHGIPQHELHGRTRLET